MCMDHALIKQRYPSKQGDTLVFAESMCGACSLSVQKCHALRAQELVLVEQYDVQSPVQNTAETLTKLTARRRICTKSAPSICHVLDCVSC